MISLEESVQKRDHYYLQAQYETNLSKHGTNINITQSSDCTSKGTQIP